MFVKYTYKRHFNTYQIFLSDVDGLIDGSPVKLMGIQVGYVNQINIVGDDVYVKFIITKPKTKLPEGSMATVEFSGLGGSKSLELYPPEVDQKLVNRIIIAQSPKRINDSLGVLNDMFNQISEIAYNISHFMNEVGIIKNKKELTNNNSQKSFNEFLDYSEDWLTRAQVQCDKLADKLKTRGKDGKESKVKEKEVATNE